MAFKKVLILSECFQRGKWLSWSQDKIELAYLTYRRISFCMWTISSLTKNLISQIFKLSMTLDSSALRNQDSTTTTDLFFPTTTIQSSTLNL